MDLRTGSDARQRMEEFAAEGTYAFYPGQLDFYSTVARHRAALCAAEVGTGKTLGAITLARLSRAERILVIVPRGVIPQWTSEIRRFWKEARVFAVSPKRFQTHINAKGIFLTYPEAIFHGWPRLSAQILSSFGCVILDESHIYGNPDSQITKGMLSLNAPYRYAFSATPMKNALDDLFPVLGWLSTASWPENKAPGFAFDPTESDRFRAALASGLLDNWLRNKVYFLDKEACHPDTVPATVNIVRLNMPEVDRTIYDLTDDGAFGYEDVGRRATALRALCLNPKVQPVVERAATLVAAGEKVVIVNSRINQSNEIQKALADLGVPVMRIDGTTGEHGKIAEQFKSSGPAVMLMGIKCAQSYSFECASHLLIGSLEYSFSTFWQAIGRVWRVTSPKPVTIDCYVMAETIEEKILRSVLEKQELARRTTGLKYTLNIND